MFYKNRFGFTLAEVLITLGIIGVVAAMTIPVMISSYNKHITETRLKNQPSNQTFGRRKWRSRRLGQLLGRG